MEQKMTFFEKMMQIDRRIIFLFVAIAVVLPLFLSIHQKILISPEVQELYDTFESLAPGSKVMMSYDYDPASAPELQPMAVTAMKYCFSKGHKIIILGLWPQGSLQANMAIETALEDPEIKAKNPQYGKDWVNLGYMSGNELVIQRMGTDIPVTFPRDYQGTPVENLPLMQGIKNFSNIDFVFNLSAGYPGTVEWVQFVADRFHAKLGAGNTAVQAPQVYPYLRAGQLMGLLGGMKGASEFEKLTGFEGKGTRYMLSQSFSHSIVLIFIIIGNLAYFISKGKKKK
jgi:hypothetical protein